MMKNKNELNNKQAKFVDEYMKDLNATQAAIRAGYSKKGANSKGAQLLAIQNISSEIKKRQEEASKKYGVTRNEIIKDLKDIIKNNKCDKITKLYAIKILNKMFGFNNVKKIKVNHNKKKINKKKTKKFYVYIHKKETNGIVFYVGKGKNNRAYEKQTRSDWWKHTVNKYGYIVKIIKDNLTEKQALDLEKKLIKKYGRRNLGKGTLVNLTDGGKGPYNSINSTFSNSIYLFKNKTQNKIIKIQQNTTK